MTPMIGGTQSCQIHGQKVEQLSRAGVGGRWGGGVPWGRFWWEDEHEQL